MEYIWKVIFEDNDTVYELVAEDLLSLDSQLRYHGYGDEAPIAIIRGKVWEG